MRVDQRSLRGGMRINTYYLAVFLTSLTVIMCMPVPSLSDEESQTPIRTIVNDPGSYHLTAVVLEGTVSEVRELAPYFIPAGVGCYGAYTFTLRDETGTLPLAVLGICGRPAYRPPNVSDGDHVVVHARIEAPDKAAHFNEPLAVPIDPAAIQAIVTSIQPAPDHRTDAE